MDLEMVLNELSLRSPADSIPVAQQRMKEFMDTVLIATRQGVKKVLRTHDDVSLVTLAPNYPIVRWRNDSEVNRDTRLFFKSLVTKAPFLSDITDSSIRDKVGLSEFWYQGEEASGLGIALCLNALALSLRSDQRWDRSRLELTIKELGDEGDITDDVELVFHASCRDHVLEHAEWIKSRIQTEVQTAIINGLDLWSLRAELFPSLQFCESVGTQIQKLLHGDPMLQPTVRRLLELENFCKGWREGPFNHNNIPCKVTPENPVTLSKYRGERTFLCPDGEERIFTWHVRLTPGAWRIHFYPQDNLRQLIIGYIGTHLPTVNYPT